MFTCKRLQEYSSANPARITTSVCFRFPLSIHEASWLTCYPRTVPRGKPQLNPCPQRRPVDWERIPDGMRDMCLTICMHRRVEFGWWIIRNI